MASRAEIIRNLNGGIKTSNPEHKVPFYKKQDFWDAVFCFLDFCADVFKAYNQPKITYALKTVIKAANKDVIPENQLKNDLNFKIQSILRKRDEIDPEDTATQAELTTQLDTLTNLLTELGDIDGPQQSH